MSPEFLMAHWLLIKAKWQTEAELDSSLSHGSHGLFLGFPFAWRRINCWCCVTYTCCGSTYNCKIGNMYHASMPPLQPPLLVYKTWHDTTWHLSMSESTWIQKARVICVEISFIETRVARGVWVIIIKNYHTHWFLGQHMRQPDCLSNVIGREREREGQLERELKALFHLQPDKIIRCNAANWITPDSWVSCLANGMQIVLPRVMLNNRKSFQSGRLKVCYAFISNCLYSCVCFNALNRESIVVASFIALLSPSLSVFICLSFFGQWKVNSSEAKVKLRDS